MARTKSPAIDIGDFKSICLFLKPVKILLKLTVFKLELQIRLPGILGLRICCVRRTV